MQAGGRQVAGRWQAHCCRHPHLVVTLLLLLPLLPLLLLLPLLSGEFVRAGGRRVACGRARGQHAD